VSAPLFSVIIPTYNRERDVVAAVESVLAQTLSDFDVWVVDDGSTDRTTQELARFGTAIRYLKIPNGGQAAARNHGVSVSAGRYLAFLDADDRWSREKLKQYAQVIEKATDAGLFYSDYVVVDEAGKRLWSQRARPVEGDTYLELLHGNFVAASSAVVSRVALEACGGFDEALRGPEDWDLWIRIARRFAVVHVPHLLTEYRAGGADSQTTHRGTEWTSQLNRVIDKAFESDPAVEKAYGRDIRARVEYALGRTLMWGGNRSAASAAFARSFRLNPTSWRALLYLALLQTRTADVLPPLLRRALRLPKKIGVAR
jgi:glycosyltransferase involved in cell wall biosynthesis